MRTYGSVYHNGSLSNFNIAYLFSWDFKLGIDRWYVVNVRGDGNCCFNAISLSDTRRSVVQLKLLVLNYLEKNKSNLNDLFDGVENRLNPFEKQWMNVLDLPLISSAINRDIHIIYINNKDTSFQLGRCNKMSNLNNGKKPIILLYWGDLHFDVNINHFN